MLDKKWWRHLTAGEENDGCVLAEVIQTENLLCIYVYNKSWQVEWGGWREGGGGPGAFTWPKKM
jgi:hypothetical protein